MHLLAFSPNLIAKMYKINIDILVMEEYFEVNQLKQAILFKHACGLFFSYVIAIVTMRNSCSFLYILTDDESYFLSYFSGLKSSINIVFFLQLCR